MLALAQPAQIAALSHRSREAEFCAVAERAGNYPMLEEGDAETILRHEPTLVLFADYSRIELVTQVQRAGIRTLAYDRYATLEDVYAFLQKLGTELGAEDRAEQLVTECRARVVRLAERLAGVDSVRVIAPSTYNLVSGSNTTFQDLCDHAGAENLAATMGGWEGHQPPPVERMLTWPVEVVVVAGPTLEQALAPFRKLPPYQFMDAVQRERAVLLDPWMLSCVSHRRIDAYEMLARGLHPGRFP